MITRQATSIAKIYLYWVAQKRVKNSKGSKIVSETSDTRNPEYALQNNFTKNLLTKAVAMTNRMEFSEKMKEVSMRCILQYNAVVLRFKHDANQSNYVRMSKKDVYRYFALQLVFRSALQRKLTEQQLTKLHTIDCCS